MIKLALLCLFAALNFDQYYCKKCEWKELDNFQYCASKIYSSNFLKQQFSQICSESHIKTHPYSYSELNLKNDNETIDVICNRMNNRLAVKSCIISP